MFDPFKDFKKKGYLRNNFGFKDPEEVRVMEHTMFRAGLDEALSFLENQRHITYQDFLKVHEILFNEFYPWAGADRASTAPNCAVSKTDILFCHPLDAQLAVEQGLKLAQDLETMRKRPGEVMGYFAYGHPFLDGNGRTMLIIHSELCHRAGFAITWHRANKSDYLNALSAEIKSPGKGHLDRYLSHFITSSDIRSDWGSLIQDLPGLDGRGDEHTVIGEYSEEHVVQQYREFEMKRNSS
jgi:cell filamentation protein